MPDRIRSRIGRMRGRKAPGEGVANALVSSIGHPLSGRFSSSHPPYARPDPVRHVDKSSTHKKQNKEENDDED